MLGGSFPADFVVEDVHGDQAELVRGVADPRDEEPRGFAVALATGEVVGGAGFSCR